MNPLLLPKVTMLLISYNQEGKIGEAIEGALAQDYPNLEIVISDDASTDNTFSVIESCTYGYQGMHQLHIHCNPKNLGIGGNISEAVRRSSGELIFITAGDDISLPQRVSTVVKFWLENEKKPDLIACYLHDMDDQGQTHGVIKVTDLEEYRSLDDWTRHPPHVIGAAQAWTRRLFDQFDGIPVGVVGEDMVMAFRAIAMGRAKTLPLPLVKYRCGGLTRQSKPLSVNEVIRRLTRKAISSRIELLHMRDIARKSGASSVVINELEKRYQKECFIEEIFKAKYFAEKIDCVWHAKGVKADFRARMFLYAALPWVISPVFVIKRWRSQCSPKIYS